MQNHFQEQIDEGMKTLASKQGTGGLPKAPDTSTVASDVPPPPPDKTAGKTLEDQDAEADKTEAQVKQGVPSRAGGRQYPRGRFAPCGSEMPDGRRPIGGARCFCESGSTKNPAWSIRLGQIFKGEFEPWARSC